jgi:hypothetical protein
MNAKRGAGPLAAAMAAMVGLVAAACGPRGGRVVAADAPNVDRLCGAMCRREADCSPGADVAACELKCRHDRLIPYYRDDYVGAVAECLRTSTCDVIDHSAIRTCWQATRPAPSDDARRVCHLIIEKDHLCNGIVVETEDECLAKWRWGELKDSVLDELASCEEQSCGHDRRPRCVANTLGLDE